MIRDLLHRVRELDAGPVLVVGDLILDRYVFGDVERISPEAPIQVLHVTNEQERAGGAGSVLLGLAALGVPSRAVCPVGDDDAGARVRDLLQEADGVDAGGLVTVPGRPTPHKTRHLAAGQQVLRVDRETREPLPDDAAENLGRTAFEQVADCGAVLVSDYGKGALGRDTMEMILGAARKAGVPVITDPKARDWSLYAGSDVITPNRRETADASGMPCDTVAGAEAAARSLLKAHGFGTIVVTLDADGMLLVPADGDARRFPTARRREVRDVTGAGDCVLAVLGAFIAGGLPMEEVLPLANHAAGLQVERLGASPITRADLLDDLVHSLPAGEGRLRTVEELLPLLERHRERGETVVFTNGCFDLVHPGHVSFLEHCAEEGDVVVVGLNSDGSVQRLKGPGRPVLDEEQRARVLGGLRSVDHVVVFDEDTPEEMIRNLRPDVLVKGEDWKDKGVVGREIVESAGGRVVLVPLVADLSTTGIVRRVREASDEEDA